MSRTKPFPITKRQVWEAWKCVRANKGGAGVDGRTLKEFEQDLSNNLYKLWNRMASGSYMPAPVKRVEIPKADGGKRPLGIPTVSDRVAQMVVKEVVEAEEHFHPDSCGYRPGKSAHQALGKARKRCWENDWVVDLDIKSFFDSIDHDLLMKAVRRHTREKWVCLYIGRWLKAPVEMPDGELRSRDRGTPQGGVASPLLANLFLHYVFDHWMSRKYPGIRFERYADDIVCHCRTERQAEHLKEELGRRFEECGLELHPEKTKVVYCRDSDRKREYPRTSFDFLGYTFRPRRARNWKGKYFVSFLPAVSGKAAKSIRGEVRSWKLHRRSDKELEDLARMFNAKIVGWVKYYGAYYKSVLYPVLRHIDRKLELWAVGKYRRLRRHRRRAAGWLRRVKRSRPDLFAHWRVLQGQAG